MFASAGGMPEGSYELTFGDERQTQSLVRLRMTYPLRGDVAKSSLTSSFRSYAKLLLGRCGNWAQAVGLRRRCYSTHVNTHGKIEALASPPPQ